LEQSAPGARLSPDSKPGEASAGFSTGTGSAAALSAGDSPASSSSFERAIQRLGEIVESLEDGEQPLEESIALFEEGMALARSSQDILDRAERRIEELLAVDTQGKPIVRELDAD
jgi:exodeoxyribonuclease VII small subunit